MSVELDEVQKKVSRRGRLAPEPSVLEKVPWWGLILLVAGILILWAYLGSEKYQGVFRFVVKGVFVTLRVSILAYALALVLGLIAGLARVSKNKVFYTLSTLYVEIVRGVPLLVQLLYIAFVLVPLMVDGINWLGPRIFTSFDPIKTKDVSMELRAIVGLAFGYGAYLAEIYRAGIEAIPRGQIEAAQSIGLTYGQTMRYVILPQAIRIILPPLGNDFIAILKDSSLISAISVRDLTYMGRLNVSRTFDPFPSYNTVALLYLVMTLTLSALVRWIERKFALPE